MPENISKPHVLVVGEFVPEEPGDCFELEHPDDCPSETHPVDFGEFTTYTSYTCGVGYFVESDGLEIAFRHRDDPGYEHDSREVLAPGKHFIEAWSSYDPPHPGGGGEWEGGLRTVEEPVKAVSHQ